MFFFGVQPWWPWTSGEAPATRPDCLRLRSGTLRLGPECRRRCQRRTRAHCPPAPSPLLLATRRPPSPSCGPDVRSLPRGWGLCALSRRASRNHPDETFALRHASRDPPAPWASRLLRTQGCVLATWRWRLWAGGPAACTCGDADAEHTFSTWPRHAATPLSVGWDVVTSARPLF